MLDVMVDIETTGTDPVLNAMIQICAIRFDYDTGAIGPIFNASLTIPYGRHWDEDCRNNFWMPRAALFQKITETARPADEVWAEFLLWLNITGPALAGQPERLWAKPISFEWPFLQSYGRQFGELPFHYRHAVDLNSFTRGLAGHPGGEPLDKQVPFDGTPHDAVDDVLHQIKVALMARHIIQGASA
jgi:hypothetical protein